MTPRDPPLVDARMTSLTLTSQGRLVSFQAVPAGTPSTDANVIEVDWGPFFIEAGLDVRTFTPSEPRTFPPTFADTRAAWEGPDAHRPDWRLRVEAASVGSRPVLFTVVYPWIGGGPSAAGADAWLSSLRDYIQVAVTAGALIFGLWLARSNMRAGRADKRGALVIGAAAMLPLLLDWLLGADHVRDVDEEWERFVIQSGEALFVGLLMWLVYLAVEPYVRRRWPEALISWTRVLSGRFRDPLVGRDVLIGAAAGVGLYALGATFDVLPEWMRRPPIAPSGGGELNALSSAGGYVARIALMSTRVAQESLLIVFLLLFTLIVLRNRWLAYAALTLIFVALSVNREIVVLSIISVVVFVTVIVALISRVGLLAYFAAMFVYQALNALPLTLDPSAWFAARSAVTAVVLIAVATWGFYASLGGRPIFGSTFES